MSIRKSLTFFGILSFLSSCVKDKPDPQPSIPLVFASKGVFITNEGNFTSGRASLSFYDPIHKTVNPDVYSSVNHKNLGDVAQSMTIFEGKGYVVVNNSGRIVVIDTGTYQELGSISGLISPRYFLGVDSAKAYISDLYANKIHIVNPRNFQNKGSIPMMGWSEKMLLLSRKIFVANIRTAYLYRIDSEVDRVTDSVHIGFAVTGLALDNQQNVWISTQGGSKSVVAPSLLQINPQNLHIEKSYFFPDTVDRPMHLVSSPDGNKLYYIYKNAVYRFNTQEASIQPSVFVAASSKNWYGMACDPNNGDIYVADAKDFNQAGDIYRYNTSGSLVDRFEVGEIPGSFCFK